MKFAGNGASKKQRTYQDKLSAWASGKAELANLQKEAYQKKIKEELEARKKEHEMRMEYERKLYEARIQEVTDRLEFERRKREVELKILQRNL